MTEDFASDMYLLRDLLLLAQNNGQGKTSEWKDTQRQTRQPGKKGVPPHGGGPKSQTRLQSGQPRSHDGAVDRRFRRSGGPTQRQKPEVDGPRTSKPNLSDARNRPACSSMSCWMHSKRRTARPATPHPGRRPPRQDHRRPRHQVAVDLQDDYKRLGENLNRLLAAFTRKPAELANRPPTGQAITSRAAAAVPRAVAILSRGKWVDPHSLSASAPIAQRPPRPIQATPARFAGTPFLPRPHRVRPRSGRSRDARPRRVQRAAG